MYIPVISSTLPEPDPGPFLTGYTTLRLRADAFTAPFPRRRADGTPVLQLSETVLAVYYPTVKPTRRYPGWLARLVGERKGVRWTPDPQKGYWDGYAIFLRRAAGDWVSSMTMWLLSCLLARPKMPVYQDAPLAPHDAQFPLVLFTHGLCGTRNTYSQYCSRLASEGYVVIAVEHADGSGVCVVRDGKVYPFQKFADTVFNKDEDPEPTMTTLRAHQLDFRVREVYEAYAGFCRLLGVGADGTTPPQTNGPTTRAQRRHSSVSAPAFSELIAGPQHVVKALYGCVDVRDLHLAGHSFGGGTLMRLITTQPPKPYSALPAKNAVLLDPWYEPEELAPVLQAAGTPPPRTLVVNSQGWSERDDLPRQLGMAKGVGAWLCTIMGLGHQGFSDFAVMLSRSKASRALDTIHELTMGLFTGTPATVLEGQQADGGKVRKDAKWKIVGAERGEVKLHLVGKE